jgi:hypothetical protein
MGKGKSANELEITFLWIVDHGPWVMDHGLCELNGLCEQPTWSILPKENRGERDREGGRETQREIEREGEKRKGKREGGK